MNDRHDPRDVTAAAVRGSALFLTRGFVLQGVGLLATIGIARLVSPSEFGAFAIAAAVLQAGTLITNLGFPAALIRSEIAPTLGQQRAIVGFTLLVGGGLAVAAALVGFVILPLAGSSSEVVELVAVAALALPLFAARMNSLVLLNRDLRFDGVVIIQATTQLTFYAFALTGALLGAGAFGLAAAVPLSALVSLVVASIVRPWEWGISLDLKAVRGLAGFGLRVGVYRLAAALYEVGSVTLFAVVGGQALAGFYGLSRRLLSPVYISAQSLHAVGFPALARADKRTRTQQTTQGIRTSLVAVGLAVTVIVGAADPLVAVLFGERWLPSVDILTLTAIGLLLFAAVGVPLSSLALANGDARSPLLATVAQAAITFTLALVLIPRGSDLVAVGVAMAAGLGLFALVMYLLTAPPAIRAIRGPTARTFIVAGISVAVAKVMQPGDSAFGLLVAIAVSTAAWAALSTLLMRAELRLLLDVLRRYVRPSAGWLQMFRRRPEAEPAASPVTKPDQPLP